MRRLREIHCRFHPFGNCASQAFCATPIVRLPVAVNMAPKSACECCKWCKRIFNKDENPVVKNPKPTDLLKPKSYGSKECRPCFSFIKGEPDYSDLTTAALTEHLKKPENQAAYDSKFGSWCEQRREGGRRAKNRGGVSQHESHVWV